MISRKTLKGIKPIYTIYCVYLYLLFRYKLAIAVYRDWIDRQNPAHVPVPPARLRHRVCGSLDKESFLRVGKATAQNIRDLCASAQRDLYSFENILDFGCGCGRVISNFQDAPEACKLYGTDIDSYLVNWCRSNLKNTQWSTNGYQPPLPFKDNTFDFIYSISVFTHLDEDLQHVWLRELQRVAKPGAILILSVHGEHCIDMLEASHQDAVHEKGFLYVTGTRGMLKLDGLPDFYQDTFHTRQYIHQNWTNYFDILGYFARGINNHQDAVLLQKV